MWVNKSGLARNIAYASSTSYKAVWEDARRAFDGSSKRTESARSRSQPEAMSKAIATLALIAPTSQAVRIFALLSLSVSKESLKEEEEAEEKNGPEDDEISSASRGLVERSSTAFALERKGDHDPMT